MQFLAGTFAEVVARHQLPVGGANPPSLYNAQDAVYAAAFYLCDNHVAADLTGALWAYNHSDAYVAQVVTQATEYSEPTSNSSVECQLVQSTVQSGPDGFSSAALAAVTYACAQIGKPYVWGGNGDPGFDCSGLTHMAYAVVGIQIPRTAQTQYDASPLLPSGTPLQPGDLVFFGTPGNIHHVGISLGGTMMVDAPDFGRTVTERDFSIFPDYAGASRPAR
ncbi:NlpC/P60 family protein [Candidatus Protofrankia californiensis]|uniref:C40 family peptidase n=1 Tax=Candidatus Protofrankia californiensis TaxID=1839754 RepID=UPI001F49C388|nr:C40 family peptidase [Candidatus Protofrankia californiensis]